MKTSLILLLALLLNTSLILATPLAALLEHTNPWIFIALESLLLIGYILNKWVGALRKDFMIDLGYLDVYTVEDRKKTLKKPGSKPRP
ncbi:hypothetical protein [Poritiphilus flavus]|uniref:Uncharacterized protein n=1 Tax=Poritiphilus flavus TaxID=2697053 RepID=A0A6L9E7R9_9FLAO|nr:hypothetical protein [Poritiphilus flavus]NAS10825.1 hypothetical protein [Poritiphilus flavus]